MKLRIYNVFASVLKEYQENSHVVDDGFSEQEFINVINQLNLNFENEQFSFEDLLEGSNHEIEHKKEVNSSPTKIVQIALDHLRENPNYYKLLNKYVEE